MLLEQTVDMTNIYYVVKESEVEYVNSINKFVKHIL